MTRHAADQQHSRAAVLLGPPDLREEVLANGHAHIVVLAFVAEAPRHAATFDRGGDHIETGGAQDFEGLRRRVAGSLLAVRMIEDLRAVLALAGGKNAAEIDP